MSPHRRNSQTLLDGATAILPEVGFLFLFISSTMSFYFGGERTVPARCIIQKRAHINLVFDFFCYTYRMLPSTSDFVLTLKMDLGLAHVPRVVSTTMVQMQSIFS